MKLNLLKLLTRSAARTSAADTNPSTQTSLNHLAKQQGLGTCLQTLRRIPDASVEFVLTDPPPRFLGIDDGGDWDHSEPYTDSNTLLPLFTEIGRILKPDRLCLSIRPALDQPDSLPSSDECGLWHAEYVSGFWSASGEAASPCQSVRGYALAKGEPVVMNRAARQGQSHYELKPSWNADRCLAELVRFFSPKGGLVIESLATLDSTAAIVRKISHGIWVIGNTLSTTPEHPSCQRRSGGEVAWCQPWDPSSQS